MVREIELTQGEVALVDDEDYEEIAQHNWCASYNGACFYAVRGQWDSGKQTMIYMHRLIMNAPDGTEIDHINGDGLDNRRANLRFAAHRENGKNRRKQRGTSSRFLGVCWDKSTQKWLAYLMSDGKRLHLGRHQKEKDAAQAYNEAATKYHGEFASLNVIDVERSGPR